MLTFEPITENVFLATSDLKEHWKCNGLILTSPRDSKAVLIDCSFREEEIEQIFQEFGEVSYVSFMTHLHVDHVQYTHLYEKLQIPIYSPIPENEYITDLQWFMQSNGAVDFGISKEFLGYINNFTRFRPLRQVIAFTPGDVFDFDSISLKSIPLPGHSPGHTGFEIKHKNPSPQHKDVLFVADIGIEEFGPWYGFKYCDITQYLNSIDLAKQLFKNGDFILLSSHGAPIFDPETLVFEQTRAKFEESIQKLRYYLEIDGPDLSQLVGKGIYYKREVLAKMDEKVRELYHFWEALSIQNLLDYLDTSSRPSIYPEPQVKDTKPKAQKITD